MVPGCAPSECAAKDCDRDDGTHCVGQDFIHAVSHGALLPARASDVERPAPPAYCGDGHEEIRVFPCMQQSALTREAYVHALAGPKPISRYPHPGRGCGS